MTRDQRTVLAVMVLATLAMFGLVALAAHVPRHALPTQATTSSTASTTASTSTTVLLGVRCFDPDGYPIVTGRLEAAQRHLDCPPATDSTGITEGAHP